MIRNRNYEMFVILKASEQSSFSVALLCETPKITFEKIEMVFLLIKSQSIQE